MASGTIIGGNGGGEGSREKQRWAERKVYSRKSFKGLKTNDNSNAEQPQVQTLDSPNSSQQQLLAASDDSSSSRKGNGAVKQGFPRQENRVTIHLTSRSKQEMREVRRKLKSELDLVRNLVKKIEGKEGKVNGVVVVSRPLHQLSVSVLENSQGGSENVEKEKRTPKANQFYRNSEFLLAKDKFPPADSSKKSKPSGKKQASFELGHGFGQNKSSNQAFKSCSALLDKLMKHKHGWVFNNPVDPEALGLRDYLDVIKHPMDLGTVKLRLNVNWYKSPREFADDVRLTFSNAMIYNPKGQDVHVMAEQLSTIFEEKWAVIEADYTRELKLAVNYEVELPTPTSRKVLSRLTSPAGMTRILDRSESMSNPFDPKPKPTKFAHSARTTAPKKPKAKDSHKRDMTYDEKQKLSTNLQNLPSDKLENVIQIIKKRTISLCQKDDEIEVDIDIVDTETLWELDRFVTNYKKSLSKNKNKSEIPIHTRAEAMPDSQEKNPVPTVVEAPKETKSDEKNVSSSSPVQLEKPVDNASRSSSSSSFSSDSGSSSSDSDSESSSGDGSDAGHSPKT
ncbi:Transcription factor like [Actinidia chinensis var. chinensis]|uniref:Transcription factor like n=1 Tax=Actinidia chinensis var. chinensis TaxID=1590841 RepID=A0A2R6QTQ9_ACTCC|nr:Transcription factor like [Actinidia chinensis var. chinensis]